MKAGASPARASKVKSFGAEGGCQNSVRYHIQPYCFIFVTSPDKTPTYDASKLSVYEGLAHVRKRIGMYLGSSGSKGLHHCIEEIVANSVDEVMAGHGKTIVVEVASDHWVTVSDQGRGIPVDMHPKEGVSGLELVLTKLGAGGKWGEEGGGYKVSGGLHGVGSSVVNAVSSHMKAWVHRDGHEWTQEYKRGVPTNPVKRGKKSSATGTTIAFLYDTAIFDKSARFDRSTIAHRLRELCHLNPGVEFLLRFHDHKDETFYSESGLADYMRSLVAEKDAISAVHKQPVSLQGEVTEPITRYFEDDTEREVEDTTVIDVALYWTSGQNEVPHLFVNSINTPEGGTHYSGFRSGLRKALNAAAEELGMFRAKDTKFEQGDTREGLHLGVAVRVSNPEFQGQTKDSLGNPEVEKRLERFVAERFREWLVQKSNRAEAEAIIGRVVEARDGRIAASKARAGVRERKGLLGGSGLPGKLADCSSKDREETEIFFVEGDSAGGGMKLKRNRSTQAVLPLRGKIQNAEKSGESTLNSEAIKDILAALGGTVTPIQVQTKKNGKVVKKTKLVVDLAEPRYGKVVMCTDADVDGGHIVTLLMTFFFRFAPGLIRDGRLWLAQLPLYRIEHKKHGRMYLFTDEDLQRHIKKDDLKRRPDGTHDIGRFKGLGEMQPEQLHELALNPLTRRLSRVVIDDLAEAEDMTSLLMGSAVDRRREYIEEHALDVEVDV